LLNRNRKNGMKKSNIVQILRTFSSKEVREFRKWLLSPMHNLRKDVIVLLDFLVEERHKKNEDSLDKTYVFQVVHPNETYDDAKMRQSIFFLMRCVEEFLTYQALQQDEIRKKLVLAEEYRKRNLEKAYQKCLKTAHAHHENQVYKNNFFYRNEYFLHQEKYNYIVSRDRAIPMNLQELSDALDTSFLADKLRQSCHMLSHQTVYNTDYEIGLITEVLSYVEKRADLLTIPAIGIYYFGYKTLTEKENETHFKHLKNRFFDHGKLFPRSEINDIQLIAINYCIGRINLGNKSYIRELFELYKQGLEMETLIENGILSRYTFRNLVGNGILLKEFAWVKNFIHEYKVYLKEKHRESIVHYSLAKLHFEKGDFPEAMQLLNQIEYDDILMNLNGKTMLLKMYYAQEEFDALDSLLESMRTYMQRKKVIAYHKSNYKNIIRFTKKLVKLNPYNKVALKKLSSEIEGISPLTEKEWLLRELSKLT